MDAKEVVQAIKDREIEAVDLRFCDLPGLWQHFTCNPKTVTEESFEEGFGFDRLLAGPVGNTDANVLPCRFKSKEARLL